MPKSHVIPVYISLIITTKTKKALQAAYEELRMVSGFPLKLRAKSLSISTYSRVCRLQTSDCSDLHRLIFELPSCYKSHFV
jgi:hypothetical protein